MTERPIEEIIGWQWIPGWKLGLPHGSIDRWKRPDGKIVERAEVDDLAAWLVEHGCIDSVRLEYDPRERSYIAVTWRPNGQQISGWGQTRRDALVAVVRKVAKERLS